MRNDLGPLTYVAPRRAVSDLDLLRLASQTLERFDSRIAEEGEPMFGRDRTMKFPIDDILEALHKGKAEHQEIVEEAQEAYRKAVIVKLEEVLAAARAGKRIVTDLQLELPQSYLSHYENAIAFLEGTKKAGTQLVDMTSAEYEQYVRNNWSWMDQFLLSNSRYSGKARSKGNF